MATVLEMSTQLLEGAKTMYRPELRGQKRMYESE